MDDKTLDIIPNLFIPGAAKAGTSSLHVYLSAHPDIYMSELKEPHYWTDDRKYAENSEWYTNLFIAGKKHKYRGESSTGYMIFDSFTERIGNLNDEIKFIFILRNPVDRAYSHYWWLRGQGYERNTFRSAMSISEDTQLNSANVLPGGNYKYYYQFGLYGSRIQHFQQLYGRKNILTITTEALRSSAVSTLNECFRFLEVDELRDLPTITENQTVLLRYPLVYSAAKKMLNSTYVNTSFLKYIIPPNLRRGAKTRILSRLYDINKTELSYPVLKQEDREWLADKYRDEVTLLKSLTNKTYSEWTDFL